MPSTPGTLLWPGTSLDDADSLIREANNVSTTLNGAHNNSVTTITVVSTTGFPATGIISIDDEIIYYTGTTATTFTGAIRGSDGSSAASHSSGASTEGRVVARHLSILRDAIIALETKIGTASSTPITNSILNGSAAGIASWSSAPTIIRLNVDSSTPVYDLASSLLAAGTLYALSSTLSIATTKVLHHIRISKSTGAYNVYDLAGTGSAAGIDIEMQAESTSASGSAIHGALVTTSNKSPNTAKALYGRAIAETGCTGVIIAGVFAAQSVAGATCYILQLAGTDNTDFAAFIQADNLSAANFGDGIVYSPTVRIEAGGAFFKAFSTAGHDGYFLSYADQVGTQLFVVDKNGDFLTYPRISAANPAFYLGNTSTGWYHQKVDSDGRWRLGKGGVQDVLICEGTTGLIVNGATANPATTNLPSKAAASIIIKNNKFYFAYNNAGTITYISIPLDGSTTTWTHSTTVP